MGERLSYSSARETNTPDVLTFSVTHKYVYTECIQYTTRMYFAYHQTVYLEFISTGDKHS